MINKLKLKNFLNIYNLNYKYQYNNKINLYLIRNGLNKNLIKNLSNNIYLYFFIYKFKIYSLKFLNIFKLPDWSFFECPNINYDNIIYYSSILKDSNLLLYLKTNLNINFLDTILIKNNSIDVIFDSISVLHTTQYFLKKLGIIFLSLFDVILKYPLLIKKYLGTVVSYKDNFFANINSIIFSEGSFCYISKYIKCNFNLSTYFKTNSYDFAQFERTLLIASEFSYVGYLEGCTALMYKESQLHIAIVEIIVKNYGYVKYYTLQNWYRGDYLGNGGLYNFTTKRGICFYFAKLDWIQIELGSIITWKYPSTILKGNYSISNFYSISFISDTQIADTGSKIYHIGSYTKSYIISKSISLNKSLNIFRGLVYIKPNSYRSYNYTECSSLIFGNNSLTITIPYIKNYNNTSVIKQEAFISKIEILYLFLLMQRGLSISDSISLIIIGFCSSIYNKLPFELNLEIPILFSLKVKDILK
ncbi:SufB protein, putative [Plasmodium chabaudi chabaudi]|uniref:Cysteine desulfurase activator complex subunit SufB (SufB) n=2 Tax=Plasmodium chabaudi TaxID=5825 RepID=R4ZCV9_PLACU|nr:cysteine desulfurase activator complex subunit SufB (SufB) [Plasmodium chabaudi chabaudi]BAL70736.1 SufB [Plasmodium chabaudi]CCP24646.1 cysteine desulfurase activator complex subunit SufB (SufB) [Plasmodium chabaudi chabaudi]CCP24677.1 cysteine desulfurase activator complex subunit SufB (SufB) [Plasmodium chabaudi chabaudi]CDR17291.1 FeS cluster assembly protein SufB, putative [Plasmodium chabaudi chabaudi]SCL89530.1 SufB protein, putative [Plasmodium chabaudi chabaudi]|eukprot:YP_009272534.1 cysteine desulfurase activator complex subunit SufB (SufB) (apicoplast) [Plasmodium chabaudi chabaudi]